MNKKLKPGTLILLKSALLAGLFFGCSSSYATNNTKNASAPNVDPCSLLGGDWIGSVTNSTVSKFIPDPNIVAITIYHSDQFGNSIKLLLHDYLGSDDIMFFGTCQNGQINIQHSSYPTIGTGNIQGTKINLNITGVDGYVSIDYVFYKSWLF